MKKLFLLIGLALTTASFQACTQTNASQTNIDTEKAAVLKTIEDETRLFYKKDHAAWSEVYVHSPKTHWVCVEEGVTLRANGWNDLSAFVAGWMKENPEPMDYEKSNFKSKNVQVTVQGDMAFVSMEGSNNNPDGSLRQTIGSRTMVKEDGKWKILSMTSYPSDSPKGSTPNVYVHQSE